MIIWFRLAHKRKSQLSTRIEYVLLANYYFVISLARNQKVNFPLEIYDSRKKVILLLLTTFTSHPTKNYRSVIKLSVFKLI